MFAVFALSEEHQAIREAVRAVAEAKIAQRLASVCGAWQAEAYASGDL